MKNVFVLLIMLFVSSAFAEDMWFAVGKQGAEFRYLKKSDCETKEGQECFNIGNETAGTFKDPRFYEVQTQQVDDTTKPIMKAPYNTGNCDSKADCDAQLPTVQSGCSNGDFVATEKNEVLPGFTIYCTGVSGYEQMEQKSLVVNSNLKTSIEAADLAEKTKNDAIATMQKHVAFGNRMIAYIGARNVSKNLTTAQVKQVVETYATIQQLLASGSLLTAKAEIEAATPDGVLITQADKDALLAEINAYLGGL